MPQISFKKFNGDLTTSMTSWDIFESVVHNDLTLSSIEKFLIEIHCWNKLWPKGITGLTLMSANYQEAVETLKQQFSDKAADSQSHMDILLKVEGGISKCSLESLRQLFDFVKDYCCLSCLEKVSTKL